MKKQLRPTCTLAMAACLLAAPAFAGRDAVTVWNQTACDAMLAAGQDPLTNSRLLAMMHAAAHDALNAIERRYQPYQYAGTAGNGKDAADLAVAAAAHAVLVNQIPGQKAFLDDAFQQNLQGAPYGSAREAALRAGGEAAAAILARRQHDAATPSTTSPAGTQPGEYKPTPPAFFPGLMAHWGGVTPFVLREAAQFRPAPPPALDSPRYAADLREVALLGQDSSKARTPEQSLIAKHWYEDSPYGWNCIARNVAEARQLDLWQSARLFALLNIAMADGFIGGFEAKYYYNYWRPVTAIREGEYDGLPATAGDPEWTPFLETPPVPDYPSTHSVLGGAAAAVLARFFGTDLVPFEFKAGAPYAGSVRRYWSFSEAAHENAMSRVLAGIHFRSASLSGLEQGYHIGEYAWNEILRPVQ